MSNIVRIHDIALAEHLPFVLMAGPCVVESRDLIMQCAAELKEITTKLNMPFIFKASFDKANRTSLSGFRGVGQDKALQYLQEVKTQFGVPILTDVHEDTDLAAVCEVADVLQTPAFLVRQTNFILRVAATGLPVNIKKGQFLAPWDMAPVVEKARSTGNENIMVCERGASFGYNNLVSDMRALVHMRETGCPVVYDATHSVQAPGGKGTASGGDRRMVPYLARAAIAVGVAGLFMETHPAPDTALSDGPNMVKLSGMPALLRQLNALDALIKGRKA